LPVGQIQLILYYYFFFSPVIVSSRRFCPSHPDFLILTLQYRDHPVSFPPCGTTAHSRLRSSLPSRLRNLIRIHICDPP
jgi:hypothetical protein